MIFRGLDWKIIAYLVLPIYWASNNTGHFFTVELKVCRGNKIRFSPHQIAFHVKHPHNTFIIAEALGPSTVKLFRGSRIMELDACGFKLDACCLGLDACRLMLRSLGLDAWCLKLGALALTRCTLACSRRFSIANDLIRFITRA